ncbi:MAG: 4Fe-4S dicluster domain-containing protein [Rudaea sp.]
MTNRLLSPGAQVVVRPQDLQGIIDSLARRGFRVMGPRVRDGAIVYDDLAAVAELPVGWTEAAGPGKYRMERRADGALFGYSTGPTAWKRFLNPPAQRIGQARLKASAFRAFEITDDPPDNAKMAFFGVRPCDLRAIEIQDRVFTGGAYVDPGYHARRLSAFVLVANCTGAGGTCFCDSLQTGPRADTGFDLSLTEVIDEQRHFLLFEVGTELGAEVLEEASYSEPEAEDKLAADAAIARAAGEMGRSLDTVGLKELLERSFDHVMWDQVAARCLTCSNCTLVCPTCFCSNVEDVTDLTGNHAERWRKWDSCFALDFSYIHGGSIRTSVYARYRQWMMHKLSAWYDQFGTSGCVGCGRCITWCPAGIDITEQARILQQGETSG